MYECFETVTVGFCAIDYRNILINSEKHIINDLYELDLLHNLNVKKADVRRIFYHHIIHHICEAVITAKTRNKIVIYDNTNYIRLELFEYAERDGILGLIHSITKKAQRLLPVKIYSCDEDYDSFIDKCKESGAELRSRTTLIDEYIRSQSNRRFDFRDIKKFVDIYGLTYLSECYFQDMKVKNLVFL
jgi:hypothetical protein